MPNNPCFNFACSLAAFLAALVLLESKPLSAEESPLASWPAVRSEATGLLLEPVVDLSDFTHEDFLRISASIGIERLNKSWTSPYKSLPAHPGTPPNGMPLDTVKAYMRLARQWFDEGNAIPISDVGLVSTQEDVIRRPMFNHVSAFSNEVANVFLLVQKTIEGEGWGYFAIVQDLSLDPPVHYFAELKGSDVLFEAVSCYKCHASGPLAIHPSREDLVNDSALLIAFNNWLTDLPVGSMYYPPNDPAPAYGEALMLKACSKCHADDAERGALYRAHSHSIRVLTDFGYMPPKHNLTAADLEELKAWLDSPSP